MIRLYKVLACTVALLGFGLDATRASAQTTYPFEATYNVETRAIPIPSYVNVFQATDTGGSIDAPYGLTTFFNSNYAVFNPDSSVFTFGPDPATYGLEGFPIGTLTLSGQGSEKLFGTISGFAAIDFANGVGSGSSTITIIGGEGRFSGATGIFSLLESNTLSLDPTAPIKGTLLVKGSFQTVPEPGTNTALVGVGALAVGLSLYSRHRSNVAV
jgi:hypothetical protein